MFFERFLNARVNTNMNPTFLKRCFNSKTWYAIIMHSQANLPRQCFNMLLLIINTVYNKTFTSAYF